MHLHLCTRGRESNAEIQMTNCKTWQIMAMDGESKATLSAQQEYMLLSRLLGQGTRRRKQGKLQAQQSESRILIEDKGIDGISMESRHLLLPQRHTSQVTMYRELTWGPYESAQRDKPTAQPYRLQKANRGDGQWSRWASDIRQSQPVHWSCSSKWQSSAGDDSSWKKVSDWEGSQWSAPTRRTLKRL